MNSLHSLPELLLLTPPHASSTWTPRRRQLQQQNLTKIKTWQKKALLSCSFYLVAHS